MSRPTEILIHRRALLENCQLAKRLSPSSNLVAVVKADAYGHGVQAIAKTLASEVDMFAVSSLEEAITLRNAGIAAPVLLLEGCFSADEYSIVSQLNVELVVHNQQQVAMLAKSELVNPVNVWLKIDTGMHRLGIAPENTVYYYEQLNKLKQVNKVVLTTHLASADSQDSTFTEMQLRRFEQAIEPLNQDCEKSIGNSAGLLAWPSSRSDWNRPGIMLYGLTPFDYSHIHGDQLRPVMSFLSQVIAIRSIENGESVGYGNTWTAERPSRIATVAAGYGDGYPRTAKSGTPVLVNGQRASLAGRVSMDMISIDVTDIKQVGVGDEVELWGQRLHANEVAKWADSIGYELVTRMPKRTKRRLVD